ncbi:hypothetical protein GCM10027431_01540 [Lysobacter rhizosphaerae]
MKRLGTLAPRVWRGIVVAISLMWVAPSAMAAPGGGGCDAPDARINMGSAQVPDFRLSNGVWIPNAIQINGQSSKPNPNQGGQYQWSFVGTPLGTLTNTTDPQPTFTPPDVTTSRQVTLRLTVTASGCPGSDSEDITLTITNVHDVVVNTAPHSVPTASPASVTEGMTVTLDGSQSWDAETAANNLTYTWSQTGGPPVTLATTANPAIKTFVAPNFTGNTLLTFQLTVSDGALNNANTTNVNISWTNDGPVAALNCPSGVFDVNEGQLFTFDGSASADADDGIASYEWKQLEGLPEVPGVGDWNTATVAFTVPQLGLQQTGLIPFKLTVTDHNNAKSSATCSIFIHDISKPIISVPASFIAEADSPLGGIIGPDRGYLVSAADAVDGPLPLVNASAYFTCAPPPGALFKLDQTTPVACIAHDSAGNAATAGFSITVLDKTAPVIDVPLSFAVEAEGPDGAHAAYVATSHDVVDGDQAATCIPAPGSVFPIDVPGPTTTVACNATDSHGNAAVGKTFEVAVHDTTPPALTVPAGVTVEATSAQGAIATYIATATDLVDGIIGPDCNFNSGTTFPLGDRTVTCSATDAHGNKAEKSFIVSVVDTTPPTLTVPAGVTVEATSAQGAIATYIATAVDVVDGIVGPDCDFNSGTTFPLGDTTVTCTATDAHGNKSGAQSFVVSVVDTTPPALTVPDDFKVEATSAQGAIATYIATAVDLVDGIIGPDCNFKSGTTLPLGDTTVTCSATDAHGNKAEKSFMVSVIDTTPPELTVPANLTVEATGAQGAIATYIATAVDVVDGIVGPDCNFNSGVTFPLGDTTVTCSATDKHGNKAEKSFMVSVVDTTPPALTVPAGFTVEATSAQGAIATYVATAVDVVDGIVGPDCNFSSGATFPLGDTTVICTATDTRGNKSGAKSFVVSVVDTTPPALTVPAGFTVEATSAQGAIATYIATAIDLVDGIIGPDCNFNSGTTFPLGNTTVTCTATDTHGNKSGAKSFVISVVDSTSPVIAAHSNLVAEATGHAGAAVTYVAPTTSDAVDGAGSASCLPASGSTFSLGTHTVTCSAQDAHGNVATATSFTITVQDTTAPVVYYSGDVTATAGSNSSATVNYTQPTAWDIVDGTVPVNCTPASGSTFPVGTNTVYCSATDQHNNTASGSFKVTVSYGWTGFFRPVDMAPIVNSSKAGSAIPIKFSLGGNQGMGIMAAGYPKSAPMSCGGAVEDPMLETVTAGASSLQYDSGAGQYIYVWKSEKSWAGTCRQIQVKLADGTLHTANFSFK